MACVYCFRVGSQDRFKIGRTKGSSDKRRRSVSVGSPEKLTLYREISTSHPVDLERFIHNLLHLRRAPNGEFFDVTETQLDAAIEQAEASLAALKPLLPDVEKLRRKEPNNQILEATSVVVSLRDQLREARRDMFLLEQKMMLLESKLQIEIGENLGIAGVATWKWRERWELNEKLLKQEEPELYNRYKRRASARVFRLE